MPLVVTRVEKVLAICDSGGSGYSFPARTGMLCCSGECVLETHSALTQCHSLPSFSCLHSDGVGGECGPQGFALKCLSLSLW